MIIEPFFNLDHARKKSARGIKTWRQNDTPETGNGPKNDHTFPEIQQLLEDAVSFLATLAVRPGRPAGPATEAPNQPV